MRREMLAIALLGACLYGWRLGSQDFWEPDEPDFALISREMLQRGDWIVPTRNGALYAEKPPLLYWMVAGLGKATGLGVNGWTARIPSAVCALAAVLGIWAAARSWLPPGCAGPAAMALMTMPLWALKARWLLTDMPFAAFTTLALIGLSRPLLEDKPPALWAFPCLGLAVLAKGPLGGALVVAALLAGGVMLRRNPFRCLARWSAGGLIVVAIAAPWYWAVRQRAGEGFFWEVLWGQNSRFVETSSHARGPFYYLPALGLLFPWILPALVAAPSAWRARKECPGAAFALAWCLGMLLLLSAARVKQDKYLLSMMPAAALLAAWGLSRSEGLERWTGRITAAVLALASGALAVLAWKQPSVAAASGGLALAAFLCAFCALRAPAASLAAFYLASISLALPVVDAQKSARPFSEQADRLAGSGPLAFYGDDLQAAYPYYAGRRVNFVEANEAGPRRLEAYARARPDALLILRERDWKPVAEFWEPVLRARIGGKDILAARKKAAP